MDDTYTYPSVPPRLVLARDVAVPARSPSDAELVGRSIRDPNAFTQLFQRHWDDLYRFCLNRAGSAGEDIAAEAFRVAFDHRRRYDRSYPDARPWLFGIATNLLRDHFRAARREENKLERSAAQDAHSLDDEGLCGLERQLLGPHLAAALQSVPVADRDALLLLAWADLGYEQIGQALGIPLGTVRSRIHRARQRVREHLQASESHSSEMKEA